MYDKVEEYNPKDRKRLAKFWFRFVDCFLTRNDVPDFCLVAGNPVVVKKQYKAPVDYLD